jgi:predicted ATPase
MPGRSHFDYEDVQLDPEILSTTYRVQTKWHVITGSVSSGKTTLIERLADRGYQTVAECARAYIEREMAKGRTPAEIRGNPDDIRAMIAAQWETEQGLRTTEVLFMDRAYPDCMAFCRLQGLNPNDILADCFRHRYASVFLLERLPVQQDGLRIEIDDDAVLIDRWHVRDYTALGYEVVRVPVLPVEERADFILEATLW